MQDFVYVNKKPCQVMQAQVFSMVNGERSWHLVALNPPRSGWAKVLIFCSPSVNDSENAEFYVIPRESLTRKTTRSTKSKWLKGYENAWSLLR